MKITGSEANGGIASFSLHNRCFGADPNFLFRNMSFHVSLHVFFSIRMWTVISRRRVMQKGAGVGDDTALDPIDTDDDNRG